MDRIKTLTTSACLLLAGLSYGQEARAFPAPRSITEPLGVETAVVQDLVFPPTGRKPFRVTLVLGGTQHTLQLRPNDIRSRDYRLLVDDGNGLRQVPASEPVTYRGEVVGEPGSAVAATLINGRLRAQIRCAGKTWAVQPVQAGLSRTTHVIYRREDLLEVPFHCEVQGTATVPAQEMPAADAPTVSLAEIAIDADEPFYRLMGSSVTAVENDIMGILNAVDLIYSSDVGIEYEIARIIVRTVPLYTANRAVPLFDELRSQWNGNHANIGRDVTYLFSGKVDPDSILGFAWLNSVCGSSGYGLSMHSSTSNTIKRVSTAAHELGHCWGAVHCDGDADCSIMCGLFNGCSQNLTSFGSAARQEIGAFKATRTCLTQTPAMATPVVSTISHSAVTSYDPDEVVVSGFRFDTVTSVTVGGVPASFTTPDSRTLIFTPPSPFEIATHEVEITNSAGATTANLTVTGNHPSRVEPAAISVFRGAPGTYAVHTDRNWQAMLLVSQSTVPSVIPGIVALGVGNNFTDYIPIPLLADSRGNAEITLTFPTFLPFLVTYWQAVTFDPANVTFPLETSDVITVFVF